MKVLLALIGVAAIGVALIWAGDWVYAKAVDHRYQAWEEGVERDPDGVRVGCREFSMGEGNVAVLLIHGYGDSPAVFRPMAAALAERGHRCRAMRLPGFAEPMEAYRETNLDQWSQSVRQEIRALRQDHEQVWLAGHSTGAALAIQASLADDSGVDGLLLLAPLLEVSSRRSPVLSTRQWFLFGQRFLRQTRVLETAFDIDAHDPDVGDYLLRDQFVPIEVVESLYALTDLLAGQAENVVAPVWMALAENDHVVDNEAAKRFFAELGSTRRSLVIQPLAGHVLPLDTGWERLVEAMDAFMRNAQGTQS